MRWGVTEHGVLEWWFRTGQKPSVRTVYGEDVWWGAFVFIAVFFWRDG